MVIVYVSILYGSPSAGPTYSIPSQISAQSKYDQVFWYNMVNPSTSKWSDKLMEFRSKVECYHDLKDYPEGKIASLPAPFCNPDLVIVEQFYKFSNIKIVNEIKKYNYIIVPRGELTESAQRQKKYKKIIGNLLMFSRFARKAMCIQYLTEQERIDSTSKWNDNSIIIPNGTHTPAFTFERNNPSKSVEIISIGRINKYHKGIDLLIDACSSIKDSLAQSNCQIYLYGPDDVGQIEELERELSEKGLKDIIGFKGPIYGNEKINILLKADAFIMTSRFEGHPTGLIEALSYALPCLVTTGSNMRKEIENANAGWGADNTVESIRAALLKLIADFSSFSEKGKNAYKLALTYDWDQIAKKSHAAYERLLDK